MPLPEMKVLYVEDDDTARSATSSYLRRRMEGVVEASDGSEGLRLFLQARPPIVVTDINMPVMNGLAMAREIKAVSPSVQIIVTTAHNDSRYLLEAIEIGIDQFVLKPVEMSKLTEALEKAALVVDRAKREKEYAEERERLINELTAALARVKQLSGLLPICSSCKKIRDDKGYWKAIEKYISEHSEAEFTHGICPDCLRELYPDLRK